MSEGPDAQLQQSLQEASELADQERWEEAFALLLEEETAYPSDPTLLCMLGVVAEEVDAGGMAYDFFRRSLNEQPQDPLVLVALGTGLARYDDPDAEGVLRLAALTAPDLPETRLSYGAYLAREGMIPDALAELRAARALDEEDARIARELGGALLLAGEVNAALEETERAAELAPEDADFLLLHALALFRAHRVEEGAEAAHRASLHLLDDGDAQLLAALAAASQSWADEAWDAVTRAEAAQSPPDPASLQEAEEAIEAGGEEAEAFLLDHLAPSLLRERLLSRD